MKNKFVKMIGLVAATTLLVGSMTGCGSQNTNTAADTTTAETTTDAATTDAATG